MLGALYTLIHHGYGHVASSNCLVDVSMEIHHALCASHRQLS